MPIPVECPECGTRNRFPDHLAGKNGRCKFCNSRIQVRRGRGKKSKKKQQSANVGLIVGVVAGLLVLAVGLFFVINMNAGGDANQQQIAEEGNANGETTLAAPESDSTTETPGSLPQGTSTSTETAGTTTPPVKSSFGKPSTPASGSGNQTTSNQGGLTFTRSASWSVEPDPPQNAVEFEAGKRLRIKIPKESLRSYGLVFPVSPSSVIAVRSGSGSKGKYVVHDVVTGREVGEAPSPSSSPIAALADDGSYFAVTLAGAKKIEVFDLQEKKSLGVISTSESSPFQVSTLAIWKNRLVALSNVHKGIMVWELPSGQLFQTIKGDDKFNPDYGHCFSPGGRYVAVDGQFLTKRIDIYDLHTGQLSGSFTPEGKVKVSEIEALGFSRDGTQLAAVYGIDIYAAPARKYSKMLVWDLKTGKATADVEIEPRLKEQLKPVYKSHTLESLPGGDRWLVHSLGILDVAAGQLIYSFPKQKSVDLVPSRKVMGSNWVLAATTDEGDPRLEQMTFSQEELLAGAKSAAAGGFTSDASMPPLSPSDPGKAADALAIKQWTAQIDPLQTKPLPASIKISAAGTVRDIALSRSESPIIAVRSGIDENLNEPQILSYERDKKIYADRGLELKKPQPVAKETELLTYSADGQQLAKFRVPFSAQLQGVSPDGNLVVLEQHRTNGRLDVYEVEGDGRHVVGWRPFRSESNEKHRELKRVEFLDSEHVATLNTNYKLVIWKLPNVEAVWKLDEVTDFTVSPGGKLVTVIRGGILGAKGMAVFDSQTGDGLGTVELTGNAKSIAYHPNGSLLAVSLDSEANKTIQIIDMEVGQVLEEFSVPVAASTIAWTGPDNLLLNGAQLVNRPLQSVVWSYNTDKVLLPRNQVAEQLSFIHLTGNRPAIRTVDIPGKKVATKLDPNRLADQAMLKPGDSVKLVVHVASDALLKTIDGSATESLTKQLQAAESKVAENAAITLRVSIAMKPEGSATLSKIGDRSVSETVTRKTITIDFVYTSEGKEIWKSSRRAGNLDRLLVRLKPGQSAQVAIDEQMTQRVESILKTMKLPKFIFGENASKGLGTSSLFE